MSDEMESVGIEQTLEPDPATLPLPGEGVEDVAQPAETEHGETGGEAGQAEPEPLILGKFKDQQELERAYREVESYATRIEAQLVGSQREPSPDGSDLDPERDLAPLLGRPPSTWLASDTFVRWAERQGYEWPTDAEGYVDASAVNPADLLWLQGMAQTEIQESRSQRQAATVMQQAATAYYAEHPEHGTDVAQMVVSSVADQLLRSRQFASAEEFNAELYRVADAEITRFAAAVLGARGGQAAAQQRQPPPAGAPASASGVADSVLSRGVPQRGVWFPKR